MPSSPFRERKSVQDFPEFCVLPLSCGSKASAPSQRHRSATSAADGIENVIVAAPIRVLCEDETVPT